MSFCRKLLEIKTNFTLEQAIKAQEGGERKACTFSLTWTLDEVNGTLRPFYSKERYQVPILQ
jgi:hypothetical protein